VLHDTLLSVAVNKNVFVLFVFIDQEDTQQGNIKAIPPFGGIQNKYTKLLNKAFLKNLVNF